MKNNTAFILFFFLSFSVLGGTITQSVSSFYNFGNVYPFHSSTSQRYTVSGTALTSNLLITGDGNYEVSLTYGYGYSKSITLTPTSGAVATTTIYVRFSPSTVGSLPGTISNSSIGSTTQTISVTGTCVAWAIPAAYYSTVTTQRAAALKTVLYNKILGHTVVSYTPGVWNAFATTDVQPSGKVWDVYSTLFHQASPYEFTLVTDQDAGSGGAAEGEKYNREHSFPQSWFANASPMVSDVHHIFATDKKVNNVRGNDPYGQVSVPVYTSLIGGKSGPNTYPGFSGTVFEPIDEYKGDLARGHLYMATRYENVIAGWQSNGNANDLLAGNSFPAFDAWQLNLLLEWNNLDPVSDKEMKRNNAIYAIQNNRNPFIDSPQFVQRIWGGNNPSEPAIAASNFMLTNNSNTSVTLNWKSGNGNRRIVLIRAGSAITGFPVDTIHYTANNSFTSAPQIGLGNYVVYNGTGSNVTITNLTQGTTYYYAIIEYNGWYTTANYQASGYLTSSATTLPVELTAFTATKQNEQVLLNWNTASEINNESFAIERSYDAQTWEEIGTVKGAGTTTKQAYYQFFDNNPQPSTRNPQLSSTIFYRLKQTDYDGKETSSKTVSVEWDKSSLAIVEIAPNPFTQSLRIFINSNETTPVTLHIQNLIGEQYVTKHIQPENGSTEINLDNLGTLPAGVYFLHLQQQQGSQYFKLIKR
ncbi:MAG: endonuclease [Bacteroidota bacterium]